MIQKRYQYRSNQGVVFTPWFDYILGDAKELASLQNNEKEQFKGLKNEYRLSNE